MIRAAIILAFGLFSSGLATAQATEVVTEARVFEVDRSRLKELGIPARKVSAERLESDLIMNVPESLARALASGAGSRLLQTFRVTTVGESAAEFRIASRVTATQATAESQKLDVGFDFRLWTRVSLKREIAMTIISQAKIRSIDTAGADSLSPISGQPIRHEITTAEGASVAAGGFISDEDALQLSKIGTLRSSVLLNYLFSSENDARPELIVVLTPRIVRAPDEPISPSPTPTRVIPASTPTVVEPVSKNAGIQVTFYTVQVAAFLMESKARELVDELNKKYRDAYLDTLPEASAKGYLRYRVRLGHLPTPAAAKQLEEQLRRDGLETLIFTVPR